MRQITTRDRLRYAFDNTMARGAAALIGWLFLISAVMILVIAVFVLLTGIAPASEDGAQPGLGALLWGGLMRAMDAGTIGGDSGGWPYLAAMLAITFGGIFIVSILIGLLTSGIESRLDELRKGRSLVVERDHTVILGWSPQIFAIISELVLANASRSRACIAVLADHDKVGMEDEIRAKVPDLSKTHIVCRTGNPLDLDNLELVSPHAARSIIILPPEVDDPDAVVIKTILALTNNPQRRPEPYHIVTALREARNLEVAQMVGRDEVQVVLIGDLISRVTVQACRQSGLSAIYSELLDFGGDEIYLHPEPNLAGRTFGEALLAYEDSTLMGLLQNDQVQLKPPMETVIGANDSLILIAADDDKIKLAAKPATPDPSRIATPAARPAGAERTLILGWNERGATILEQLDRYVAPGSQVLVVADDGDLAATIPTLSEQLSNLRIELTSADVTDRRILDTLNVPSYDHVITLSPGQSSDPQAADARTLITLLHLRALSEQTGQNFAIVSEMQDSRNRRLAEVTRADDFIVSESLISLLLTQISENRHLGAVFADLFDPEGAEIYLRPASDYVVPGEITFATVVESARRRGEVALGYRLLGQQGDASRQYGIRLNPPKSVPITLSPNDMIVVLADE